MTDNKRFVKVSVVFCICMSWQERMVLTTHHCCYFSSSVVVDAGQHQRRQEEEEGAGSSVDQVLQEDTKTYKMCISTICLTYNKIQFKIGINVI